MIEKLTLKREHPPEWLLGSVPVSNPNIVTLHGEAGQGVAVPLALLVADSQLAQSMLHMCEGPEKHITITTEVEIIDIYVKLLSTGEMWMTKRYLQSFHVEYIFILTLCRDDVAKLQELLCMLRSKIVLNRRELQTPERQHEINIDTELNDSPIRPEVGRGPGISEVQKETRRCDLSSDSESNNNQDEPAGKEMEANHSRMLSILQNEKSRSRSLSSKTGGKFRYKQSLVEGGGALWERVENADKRLPSVKMSEPSSIWNRENNDDTSPTKSCKSLKVSIKRNDVRLAKDGPLANLDADGEPRLKRRKSVQETDNGVNYESKVKEEEPVLMNEGSRQEDNPDSDVEFIALDTCHKCHCGKTFANKTGLLSHIRQGHRDPETVQHYPCKHCPMKTTNFGSLKAHILALHPDKVKHFKCDKCNKKYTNKEKWAKHKRECHKSDNFSNYEKKKKTDDVKCPDCEAVLKSNNLSRHQKESCKGRKSKSKTTLRMYGQALSKVTKDQDPVSDEDKVALQDVEDDVHSESQQQVKNTDVEINDSDPTVMDVYFCTNCLKKGLSEKEKREHEEETGHKLDRVKLPNFLQI